MDPTPSPLDRPAPGRGRPVRMIVGAVCAALALPGLAVVRSDAASISQFRDQARRLAAQIDTNGMRIAAIGEQINGANYELGRLRSEIRAISARLRSETEAEAKLRGGMRSMAAQLYVESGQTAMLPSSATVLKSAAASVYVQAVASKNQKLATDYRKAVESVRKNKRTLEDRERAVSANQRALLGAKRSMESANRSEAALLARVEGELGELVRKEQARVEAEATRAAQARAARDEAARRARAAAASSTTTGRSNTGSGSPSTASPGSTSGSGSGGSGASGGGGVPFPTDPAPSPRVAAVIAFARAQIGKPYQWGAIGPSTYDCSGLTMQAWAAGGVYMPHYSGAQFSSFPHVSLSNLRPGDLIFKGPGGSAHVSLYVGGGMQIAATHTGDFVRLQPVRYSGLSGAVRPG